LTGDSEAPPLDLLLGKRLLFVTGKGGVGKTVVCAALATVAKARGKRVLLAEVTSQSAFETIFHRSAVGFQPREISDGIWATVCDPTQCLIDFITRFVKVRRIAHALVNNRITRRFFDAAPGVLEAVVMERIGWLQEPGPKKRLPPFDLVIVDMPSSGHALTFLDVARDMARLVKSGPLANHLNQLADRVANPDEAELVLVSQPEELPVEETIDLWKGARAKLVVPTRTVIMNRVRRTGLDPDERERLADVGLDQLGGSAELRAARLLARWERHDLELIGHLKSAIDVALIELPWLPAFDDELDLVQRIAAHLEAES
jgi:anion-transporting  ArsA/GET3 family ATPase